jgi:hypothetical protein
MLYCVFIYQSDSGLLFWEQNFDISSKQQFSMFSSFFAAIKNFVQDMVVSGQPDRQLSAISLGIHLIMFVAIPDLGIDLVFIVDKGDENKVKKVSPALTEVLRQFKDFFAPPFSGDLHPFSALDAPMLAVLAKQKDLSGSNKSLTEDHETIIRELFSKKGKLAPTDRRSLEAERDLLKPQVAETINLLEKHRLLNQILQIDQRLADQEGFLDASHEYGALTLEIEELHYKLNYWLRETKEHLRKAVAQIARTQRPLEDADYKDAYRSLFDFAANLKYVADPEVAAKYAQMARCFIDKDQVPPETIGQMIQEILGLNDDAFALVAEVDVLI